MKINEDLTIKIRHVRIDETISMVLKHDVKDRYAELDRVLKPYSLYFENDVDLYDNFDFKGDVIAKLVSDSDDLSYWLMNEEEYV